MELMTPVYAKTDQGFQSLKTGEVVQWPNDSLFYVISSDGFFMGRNHAWFRSCIKTEKGPGELEPLESTANFNYPKIPRLLFEKAVGFFRWITRDRNWESALLIVWNKETQQVELMCPDQKCSSGSVHYEMPALPPHLTYMGDAHSHCNFGAFASETDTNDETHRPGLHLVVGDQYRSTPSYYCAAVVDGERLEIDDLRDVIEDFDLVDAKRCEAPDEWVAKVQEKKWVEICSKKEPNKKDRKAVEKVLRRFSSTMERVPTLVEVRSAIWSAAFSASWSWCDEKAEEFIKETWGEEHLVVRENSHYQGRGMGFHGYE